MDLVYWQCFLLCEYVSELAVHCKASRPLRSSGTDLRSVPRIKNQQPLVSLLPTCLNCLQGFKYYCLVQLSNKLDKLLICNYCFSFFSLVNYFSLKLVAVFIIFKCNF